MYGVCIVLYCTIRLRSNAVEIANDTISLLAGWTVMLGWLCARLLHMMLLLTEDPKTGRGLDFSILCSSVQNVNSSQLAFCGDQRMWWWQCCVGRGRREGALDSLGG